jgi:dimethylhistidine N-methyltransferase
MTVATAATRTDAEFLRDVLAGLSRSQKRLPAKYFYDAAGSKLFDRITELDEYYLTRTELGILRKHAGAMAARCDAKCLFIELGAGSLVKVRLLLEELEEPVGYVPVDVSGEHLASAAEELAASYPHLEIAPVIADFTRPFTLPVIPANRRVAFFPGSTIGNFEPADSQCLLKRTARLVGPGGGLLLGIDLRKDAKVLEPAYNDARGVTAAFNRNLLVRINRELGANFNLAAFRHEAIFNRDASRIEMHLVSTAAQQVRIAGRSFSFRPGESICTEYSYKYDLAEFRDRAAACGWCTDEVWTDDRRYFAVLFLTAVTS